MAKRTIQDILTDMYKIVNPSEYGLGNEPGSFNDDGNDKKAWVKLGELVEEAMALCGVDKELDYQYDICDVPPDAEEK